MVDVVVVGGGVTDASCALALARGGARVELLEAREVAVRKRDGTADSPPRCCPSYGRPEASLGASRARRLWQLTERTSTQGDCPRRAAPRRSLRLAVDDADSVSFDPSMTHSVRTGFDPMVGSLPAAVAGLFAGGFVHPGDGALERPSGCDGLAAHAANAGATIASALGTLIARSTRKSGERYRPVDGMTHGSFGARPEA